MSLGPPPVFKVGDWGFYEFRLVQIDEMHEGRITSVRDGYFETGGFDLEVLPLTLHNKVWSEEFHELHHKLHQKGSSGLNYPAIVRKLVYLWRQACLQDPENTPVFPIRKPKEIFDDASDFVNKILKTQNEIEVDNIPLFRR